MNDNEAPRIYLSFSEDTSEDELNSMIDDSNNVDDFLEKMEESIENRKY